MTYAIHTRSLLLLVASASACAGVQTGAYGVVLDAAGRRIDRSVTPLGLKISARELDDYSSTHFGALVLTFENMSSRWITLQRVQVRAGNAAQNRAVTIPLGAELQAWVEAARMHPEQRADDAIDPARSPHLLSLPLAIPPGLYARRWVVLGTKAPAADVGCIDWLVLDYDDDAGERERVALTFRSRPGRSHWQRAACKR